MILCEFFTNTSLGLSFTFFSHADTLQPSFHSVLLFLALNVPDLQTITAMNLSLEDDMTDFPRYSFYPVIWNISSAKRMTQLSVMGKILEFDMGQFQLLIKSSFFLLVYRTKLFIQRNYFIFDIVAV